MSNDKNRNNMDTEESDKNDLLTENVGKPEKKERKKAPVGAEGHRKRMFDELEKKYFELEDWQLEKISEFFRENPGGIITFG